MRHFVLTLVGLFSLAVLGAVQHRWECETSEINEETIDAYHGETVELACRMTSYGQVVSSCRGGGALFYWQTNGMNNAWWMTNAVFSAGTVKANWTPFMDVGGDSYRFFFQIEDAKGANYRANGTIALQGSPAGDIRYLPLPTKLIDFKDVTVLNPTNAPWEMKGGGGGGGCGVDTNAVRSLIDASFDGGTQKVNRVVGSFDNVSNRVFYLETATNNLTASVGYLETATNNLTTSVGYLETATNNLTTSVWYLETATNNLTTSVWYLETATNNLTTLVSGLTSMTNTWNAKLSAETDPTVGLTNNTVYASGTSRTFLVEHQSLAFTNDYRRNDAKINWTDVTNHADFVAQTTKVNNHPLSSDVELTAADVDAQSTDEAAEMRKELVNGEVLATRSVTASYYRSGKEGELGYGYAYTVVCGNGTRRYGAYVPKSLFSIEVESADPDDPIIGYYGAFYSQDDMTREITALGYDDYDNPGSYAQVNSSYTPTNSAPFSISVQNMSGACTLSSISTSATYLEIYIGGTSHYLYNFYADSYAMTIQYTDQYYDPVTWTYQTVSRTIHFALSSESGSGKEFVIFGDGGAYSTPTEVNTLIGSYIQTQPIQRTVLKERTGKDGELGDGWGYMVYDWTSDMRSWQIKIPSLVPAASYTATRSPFYGQSSASTVMYPSNPMMDLGFVCGTIIERVKSTHEKFSSDCVRSANEYIQGWGFPNSSGQVETPLVRIDADNLVYGSSEYNSVCTIDATLTNRVYTYDVAINGTGYYSNYSNEYHCVMSNFRATNNGLQYDNVVQWKNFRGGAFNSQGTNTYYATCGFTLTRNAYSFRAVTTPVVKIATIATAHYYWDPGLKCTWQMAVTNGCFYMEKISDEDLTRKD